MWKDELDKKYITEEVVAGAKSYAYIVKDGDVKEVETTDDSGVKIKSEVLKDKIEIKQKGITMDTKNCKKISFEAFKGAILNGETLESEKRFMFKTINHEIQTKELSRQIRGTLDSKRMLISNYDSVPFGFVAENR
jgi:hypothetical protein